MVLALHPLVCLHYTHVFSVHHLRQPVTVLLVLQSEDSHDEADSGEEAQKVCLTSSVPRSCILSQRCPHQSLFVLFAGSSSCYQQKHCVWRGEQVAMFSNATCMLVGECSALDTCLFPHNCCKVRCSSVIAAVQRLTLLTIIGACCRHVLLTLTQPTTQKTILTMTNPRRCADKVQSCSVLLCSVAR